MHLLPYTSSQIDSKSVYTDVKTQTSVEQIKYLPEEFEAAPQ